MTTEITPGFHDDIVDEIEKSNIEDGLFRQGDIFVSKTSENLIVLVSGYNSNESWFTGTILSSENEYYVRGETTNFVKQMFIKFEGEIKLQNIHEEKFND